MVVSDLLGCLREMSRWGEHPDGAGYVCRDTVRNGQLVCIFPEDALDQQDINSLRNALGKEARRIDSKLSLDELGGAECAQLANKARDEALSRLRELMDLGAYEEKIARKRTQAKAVQDRKRNAVRDRAQRKKEEEALAEAAQAREREAKLKRERQEAVRKALEKAEKDRKQARNKELARITESIYDKFKSRRGRTANMKRVLVAPKEYAASLHASSAFAVGVSAPQLIFSSDGRAGGRFGLLCPAALTERTERIQRVAGDCPVLITYYVLEELGNPTDLEPWAVLIDISEVY